MPPALVDLLASRSIFLSHGRELIRRDSQLIELDQDLLHEAREELLSRPTVGEQARFRWGYLLGVEGETGEAAMPAAQELKREIYDKVVAPVGHCRQTEFKFSFSKAGEGQPPAASEGVHYAGYHLDTHAAIEPGVELLRVLVNLGGVPRIVRFAPIDRSELERRGIEIARSDYRVGDLPGDIPSETVEVSGFDGEAVSYLTFWASAVPHVGVETAAGYFLASFEGLARF